MLRLAIAVSSIALIAACGGADEAADDRIGADATPPGTETVVAQQSSPDAEVTDWIKAEYAEDVGEGGTLLYRSGEADLNGDGTNEILAYVGGPSLCGTGGCNLVVLQRTGQGLQKIGDISVSQLPVGVFPSSTNGWRDLAVSVYGGGMPAGVAKVPFGDDAYAENPTVAPATLSKDVFETVIEDGPLDPVT